MLGSTRTAWRLMRIGRRGGEGQSVSIVGSVIQWREMSMVCVLPGGP